MGLAPGCVASTTPDLSASVGVKACTLPRMDGLKVLLDVQKVDKASAVQTLENLLARLKT